MVSVQFRFRVRFRVTARDYLMGRVEGTIEEWDIALGVSASASASVSVSVS